MRMGGAVLRFAGRASEECSALEALRVAAITAALFFLQARMRRVGAVAMILTNRPSPRGWNNWNNWTNRTLSLSIRGYVAASGTIFPIHHHHHQPLPFFNSEGEGRCPLRAARPSPTLREARPTTVGEHRRRAGGDDVRRKKMRGRGRGALPLRASRSSPACGALCFVFRIRTKGSGRGARSAGRQPQSLVTVGGQILPLSFF